MMTTTKRRLAVCAFCAVLVGTVLTVASPAPAAFWKKTADRDEDKNEAVKAVNRNRYPNMVFARGVLGQGLSEWRLDRMPLAVTDKTRVSAPDSRGRGSGLVEGREALVMGYYRAGVLVAHHVTVFSCDESARRGVRTGRTVDGKPDEAPRRLRQ